jgi:putative hydrolase of the HAD superfamily
MIKTVIFDLDDTLYNEVDYCRSGFAAVATFLADHPNTPSKQVIFEALWDQFSGGNHTKTFNVALDQLSIKYDQALISDLINQYRYHTPSLVLPEDSKSVLDQLSTYYTLGLISDGFLPAQQLKVASLGIEKHFKAIIYTEALGRQFWKPSPVAFERILEMLSAEPQESVYVADNPEKDFIAPNQLGWATIQVIRPARVHTDDPTNPDVKPQHTIDDIMKLPDMLENL